MQLTNNTHSQVMPGYMHEVKLPPLPDADVKKLDRLLAYLKENKTEPVNIYMFCKAKWGDNRLLYLYFAEYLRKNSFTSVQSHDNGEEYAWKHMIAPAGLAFDGFKSEYARQHASENQTKEAPGNFWQPLRGLASVVLVSISFLRLRWLS